MAGDITEDELRWRLDLAGFMCGMQPTAAELAAAPLLSAWKAVVRWRSLICGVPAVRIAGFVRGHPDFDKDGAISTLPIVWIDVSLRWCRSESRLYRLTEPFAAMDDDEEVEPDYGD